MMITMMVITEKICTQEDRPTNSSQTTARFIYFYTYYEKEKEHDVIYWNEKLPRVREFPKHSLT